LDKRTKQNSDLQTESEFLELFKRPVPRLKEDNGETIWNRYTVWRLQ